MSRNSSINYKAALKILGVVFLLGVCISNTSFGQVSDSVQVEVGVSYSLLNSHKPMKATLMSAIVPGLGQIYNSKKRKGEQRAKPNYMKVPVIYAGLGAGVYFLSTNVVEYKSLKNAYLFEIERDASYIDAQALDEIEATRRYAEISVVAIAAVYVLNIIDASVGAHLYHFDVSDDLSFNFNPMIFPSVASNITFAGGTIQLNF